MLSIQAIERCCEEIIKSQNSAGNKELALHDVEMLCRVYAYFVDMEVRAFDGNRNGLTIGNTEVDIHFWRNWDKDYDTIGKRKKSWKQVQAMFHRFFDGYAVSKTRKVMITFWDPRESWKDLHPFGVSRGNTVKVNKSKAAYFPFVTYDATDKETMKTDYSKRVTKLIDVPGHEKISCTLIGSQLDILNAAIYW